MIVLLVAFAVVVLVASVVIIVTTRDLDLDENHDDL